ncbi:MAG: sorbosone dehydrogenase family protein [Sphingobacteriales bacterium]|nr:MAG: sorbosone dehydrogenase family protein [Sphingobacteriales bacterium]
MKKLFVLSFACLSMVSATCQNKALEEVKDPRLTDIKVPAGFTVSIFADNVDNARSMVLGERGTVFVGNRAKDKVHALVDENNDGVADKRYVIASGLNMPNGVAFRQGSLYVAELNKIWRFDNIEVNLAQPPKPVLVSKNFPSDKHHGWKYVGFGPDDKLYVPVGAPCNVCNDNEKDPRYSSITRMNPDGSGFEVYAHGIRNSVGFDWHPQTKEMWFTENGRDQMGDDVPPDELNIAPKKDMNFGFPYCHGNGISDPEFGKGKDCSQYTQPAATLAPHTAALGMKFYTGSMFPDEYKNQVFIAEHGSWNRSTPIGYRVMLVRLDGNKVTSYEEFATGWLKNGKAWGRPVDVLQMPDGSLLVSDDFANVIYRITYNKK